MQQLISEAQKSNKKLAYTGSINEKGIVQLAINQFSNEHPFYRLQGPDNMIIFQTKRYHSQALIIQGPGAGAEVTAAGLLAELLHLVDYLGR